MQYNTMLKLTRLIGMICVTLFISIGATMLISRTHQTPLAKIGLGVCDGMLCFLSITPGVTKWTDIPILLERMDVHNVEYDDDLIVVEFAEGSNMYIYHLNSGADSNVAMEYNAYSDTEGIKSPFSAADILLRFGSPCYVAVDPSGTPMRLIYPLFLISIDSTRPFSYSTSVSMIAGDRSRGIVRESRAFCLEFPKSRYFSKWKGFASSSLYKAEYKQRLLTD